MDAVVVGVGDIEVTSGVNCYAVRILELTVAATSCAESRKISAIGGKLLNVVFSYLGNVNVARFIGYSKIGVFNLSRLIRSPKLVEIGSARGEFLDAVVAGVDNI